MKVRGRETAFAKNARRPGETIELGPREIIALRIIGRSQMRHQTVQPNVPATLQCLAELQKRFSSHAESTHPGVDFQMNVGDYSAIPRRAIERFDHVGPVNDRSQTFLQAYGLLPIPKPAEAENRLRDPRAA